MTYVDGFAIPVATADRDAFIAFASRMDALMLTLGATRVVECWGDDVPAGTTTDFARSVGLREGETPVFSRIKWPDKATRDAGMARMMTDERFTAAPMPFDGARMIFGGFAPVVDVRA